MQDGWVDTLIISDVHLGSEVSRAKEALHLLQTLRFRRLILLGDIFSDLNFRRLTKEHWHFLSHIRKLSNPKRNVEVIWVEGNHDHGLSDLMSHLVGVSVYQCYVWEYQGVRHLAIHGHQFDRFAINNLLLSRLGHFIYLYLQKLDRKEKFFVRYLDRLNTHWLRLSSKVALGALGYAKQGNAGRVFCGHTHVALHTSKDGVAYYNSGSWIDFRCTYITVDEEGVRINVYDCPARTDNSDPGEEREQIDGVLAEFPRSTGLRAHAAYESVYC